MHTSTQDAKLGPGKKKYPQHDSYFPRLQCSGGGEGRGRHRAGCDLPGAGGVQGPWIMDAASLLKSAHIN